MTQSIYDALASLSVFVLPIFAAAVEADRLAWKYRVKQSLANWEPIEWCQAELLADREV